MANSTTASLILLVLCNAFLIANCELVDMSFPHENNMVTYPGLLPFNITLAFNGSFLRAPFAMYFEMKLNEHTGTHIDAPVHFTKGAATVDEIPPQSLIGEAIVINITEQALKNRDYELTVDDLEKWEAKHGKIPDGSILFVLSGFGKYWGNYQKYMGTSSGNSIDFHWPGFHKAAAQWLVDNRKIKGIGIDARSFDNGPSKDFWAHRILLGNNIYALESVANIEKLPVKGAIVYVMPMKIKGGSGGPTRIIAQTDPAGGSSHYTINIVVLVMTNLLVLMFC